MAIAPRHQKAVRWTRWEPQAWVAQAGLRVLVVHHRPPLAQAMCLRCPWGHWEQVLGLQSLWAAAALSVLVWAQVAVSAVGASEQVLAAVAPAEQGALAQVAQALEELQTGQSPGPQ